MATFRCGVCGAFTTADKPTESVRCRSCESVVDRSGKPQPVDTAELSQAIETSPVPIVVDFWAPWCGPCVWSAPIVKTMAARLAGEVVVLTLDTHESPQAGEEHAIYAIPTLALFHRGEELSRQIGLANRADLEAWIRDTLRSMAASDRGATAQPVCPRAGN